MTGLPESARHPDVRSCSNSGRDDYGGDIHMKDNRLLDGRAVRDRILDGVAERVRLAAEAHTIGRLVSISIGEHREVAVYVRGQATAARRVGLRFEEDTWPSTLTQEECKARLV